MGKEQELKIRIPKTKHYIYAKQYSPLKRPVVVLVHGLTGFMDEALLYNAARYFDKRGFSSMRFNLYGEQKDARKIRQTTLKTHAQDLDLVVRYLRRMGATKIFCIGHSYGGPTILLSKEKEYDGIVLWDASYRFIFKNAKYLKEMNAYLIQWGVDWLMGQKMYAEPWKIAWERIMDDITVPIKIITAEKGLVRDGKKYYTLAKEPKAYTMISKASHRFEENGVLEKLHKATIEWFEKFI